MAEAIVDPSRLEAAQQLIEQEHGPRRRLSGPLAKLAAVLPVGMSLLFLYWAWAAVTAPLSLIRYGILRNLYIARRIQRRKINFSAR